MLGQRMGWSHSRYNREVRSRKNTFAQKRDELSGPELIETVCHAPRFTDLYSSDRTEKRLSDDAVYGALRKSALGTTHS